MYRSTLYFGVHLLLIGLLLPSFGAAQKGDAALVMRSTGEVRFDPGNGEDAFRVYSGNYLLADGRITLSPGATVEMVYEDRYREISKAGTFQVGKLFGEKQESEGLMTRFFNFISNGVDQSKSRETLEKAYLKNQGNAQGNTRGLSTTGLVGIRPFGGKLSSAFYSFTWPAYPDADHYEFSILDARTGDFLITAIVSGTVFRINPGQLELMDGDQYTWECRAVTSSGDSGSTGLLSRGAPKIELAGILFTYATTDFNALVESLRSELPGKEGTALYELSLAQALEDNGYLHDADYLYQSLIKQADKAGLMRQVYASFLARWNLRREAEEVAGL